MRGGAKEATQATVIVLIVIGAAYVAYRAFIAVSPHAERESPGAPDTGQPSVWVGNVSGHVEVQREMGWQPAKVGDRMAQDEAIRTGTGGKVDLRINENSRITVAENSDLAVSEVTQAVHRFNLRQGRVSVDYKADGERVLRIEGREGGAVAEARAATFNVLNAANTFVVATTAGVVDLEAEGVAVQVPEGKQAVARAGQAPSAPTSIPTSLLLKVAGASRPVNEDLCAVVEGKVDPGTEVVVDGVVAAVRDDGTFSVPVERRPLDKSETRVRVRDATGLVQERVVACQAPGARIRDFSIRWGSKPDAD